MSGIVSKKLGIREGTRAIFLNAPEAARGAIDPPSLDVASELAGEFDYIHLFARTQAELDDTFPKLMAHLNRFLSQGTVAQVAGFAWIPLDINDFPTRHYYGLGLWQNHIERILAGWVGELGVPIYRGREVTGSRRTTPASKSRSPTASRCGRNISSGATEDAV